MTPLDSEFITEEARQCALDVFNNTKKLIRAFSSRQMQALLSSKNNSKYQTKSAEFNVLIEAFEDMDKLYTTKLSTP